MDPTNQKANANLEALEKHATNSSLVENSLDQTGASTSSDFQNVGEDEVMEVQPDVEAVERLPSIEEEADADGWEVTDTVPTEQATTGTNREPNEQVDTEAAE